MEIQYVTYKDLILIVLASSGLLTIVFTIISRLFDKSSRVIIMDEIKKIDEKYQNKVDHISKSFGIEITALDGKVNEFKMNYLDRFEDIKNTMVSNKELSSEQHSETLQILAGIKSDIKYLKQ